MSFCYQMLFTTMFKLFIEEQKHEGDYFNSLILRDSYQNFARSILCGLYFIAPIFAPLFVGCAISSTAIIISGNKCLNRPLLSEKYSQIKN